MRQRYVVELSAAERSYLQDLIAASTAPARKLDGEQEAHQIALVCGAPPAGYADWSPRLLADSLVELEFVERISHQMVGRVLKEAKSNRIANDSG